MQEKRKSCPQYLLEEIQKTAGVHGIVLTQAEAKQLLDLHESETKNVYRNIAEESSDKPLYYLSHEEAQAFYSETEMEMNMQKETVRKWLSEKIKNGELKD